MQLGKNEPGNGRERDKEEHVESYQNKYEGDFQVPEDVTKE